MARGSVEIVEYGDEKVNMVLLAVKRLYDGVMALKIAVDTLNENVYATRDLLKEMREILSKTTAQLKEERELMKREISNAINELRDVRDRIEHDVKLTIDLFLERLNSEMKRLEEAYKDLPSEISAIKSKINETLSVSVDSWNEVKSEVTLLRSETEDLQLSLRELALQLRELNENVCSRLRELELLVADMSTRLAKLEELATRDTGEQPSNKH